MKARLFILRSSGWGKWAGAALVLLAIALRLPGVLLPPSNVLYNLDEMELVNSTLGLLAGRTPTTFVWPAGTLLWAMLPTYALDFLVQNLAGLKGLLSVGGLLDAVSHYLGAAYYDPTHSLVLGRLIVALCGVLTVLAGWWLSRGLLGFRVRVLFVLLLACSPLFVLYSYILKVDAVAVLFWVIALLALLRALRDDPGRAQNMVYVAAGATGLAAASRLTSAVTLLLVIAVQFILAVRTTIPARQVIRRLAVVLLLFLVPLLLFVPFIWTTPLAFFKGAFGAPFVALSIWRAEGRSALPTLLAALPSFVGWLALAAAGLGSLVVWRTTTRAEAALLLFAFLLLIIPLAMASTIYDRYALPLLPIVSLWAAFALDWLFNRLKTVGLRAALAFLVLVLLALNVATSLSNFRSSHAPSTGAEMAGWLIQSLPADARLAVPADLRLWLPPDRAALERVTAGYHDPTVVAGLDRYQQLLESSGSSTGLASYPPSLLEGVFGQIEGQDQFRYDMMFWLAERGQAPGNARDVLYHVPNPDKPDLISTAKAWDLFRNGQVDVVVAAPDPAAGFSPLRCVGPAGAPRYCAYALRELAH